LWLGWAGLARTGGEESQKGRVADRSGTIPGNADVDLLRCYDYRMPERLTPETTSREFATDVLDESSWPSVLTTIVGFLSERNVKSVTAEFGFVLARDLRGEKTPENCIVQLGRLEALMEEGFRDGTIEWGGGSDFYFTPVGVPMQFMLCNDADLHFSSADLSLLLKLSQQLSRRGVRV
jgi:hypothetical protein